MNNITEKWYDNLVDECKDIITETIFASRWALVEGYHKLGERIREDLHFKEYSKGTKTSVQDLARKIEISERTLYYSIAFYDKYPKLDEVPEGKNISWNKIITKHLPEQKENKIEIPMVDGKFEVIVIDPPWPYGTEYNKDTRRIASPYPELSIKELEGMQIPSSDNASLWLWTTHRFIWDAKKLMELWGFEYKAILVWNKEKLGMGSWLRMQCEFCLIGIKGKPEWNMTNQRDIISYPREEHSAKPEGFYKLVEGICKGKKLEIFARQKRAGWEIYGNEV